MVLFCIPCLALVAYFAIASIFFPKYRVYLKEGWLCFMDKIRGKRCSVSFDNRMRIAFSAWLTRKGMVRIGRFLHDRRNFNYTLSAIMIISTVISIYLLALLVQFWLYPPCDTGSVCTVDV
ncbi:MAG: hypothetical protein JXC85_02000 [Candidatus Aenigmarchaeota archaeon]|nr:hypothetical protein [Candidatus Aenigmarchaeota archaeon]